MTTIWQSIPREQLFYVIAHNIAMRVRGIPLSRSIVADELDELGDHLKSAAGNLRGKDLSSAPGVRA